MKLDLHGNTTHAGWQKFCSHVEQCYYKGVRKFVVVTGHGAMQREIKVWCHNHRHVQSVEQVEYNTGAYRVTLLKQPKQQSSINSQPQMETMLKKLYKKYNN